LWFCGNLRDRLDSVRSLARMATGEKPCRPRRRRSPTLLMRWTWIKDRRLAFHARMTHRQITYFSDKRQKIKKLYRLGYEQWKKKHFGFSTALSGSGIPLSMPWVLPPLPATPIVPSKMDCSCAQCQQLQWHWSPGKHKSDCTQSSPLAVATQHSATPGINTAHWNYWQLQPLSTFSRTQLGVQHAQWSPGEQNSDSARSSPLAVAPQHTATPSFHTVHWSNSFEPQLSNSNCICKTQWQQQLGVMQWSPGEQNDSARSSPLAVAPQHSATPSFNTMHCLEPIGSCRIRSTTGGDHLLQA